MDCINHSGVAAAAFCQNCGKPLCAQCVRQGAGGQILCEQDFAAWQRVAQPFAQPPAPGPNPGVAAALGIIPGVGAMYNGQFFKGLIHVVVFAVLISITEHYDIFGLFIAAWIFYQSFEAYHTAKARRDGTPLPDPLGLNEVGNWLNLGWRGRDDEWARPQQAKNAEQAGGNPAAGPNPGPNPGVNPGGYQAPNPAPGTPYQNVPYQNVPYENVPYQGVPYTPASGFDPAAPGAVPPVPPPPYWRRREPIGAVILIGLGLIFLLNQLGYVTERIVHYSWPLVLIALGAWLIVRRLGDTKGGPR
jgi:TM2 domain-containing membrane protein YozV